MDSRLSALNRVDRAGLVRVCITCGRLVLISYILSFRGSAGTICCLLLSRLGISWSSTLTPDLFRWKTTPARTRPRTLLIWLCSLSFLLNMRATLPILRMTS